MSLVGTPHRVLALYYPWYGTPFKSGQWMHQEGLDSVKQSMASHTHFPVDGPYDSTDPAVLDRHLKAAKSAGIDTLVCSWWGQNDPTDKAVQALLERAKGMPEVTICVYWERMKLIRNREAALAELSYILTAMGRSSAYLKVEERPVVFLYQNVCQSLTVEDWAWVLNEANRKFPPGVIVLGQGISQADVLLWDGQQSLGTMYQLAGHETDGAGWMRQNFELPLLVAKRARQISVVAVMPGYDDRKANSLAGQVIATAIDRQDGKLYSSLWEEALREGPDWILVNSFNQWHSGTEIEPSVELGDKYLKLTQEYATRFKSKANR